MALPSPHLPTHDLLQILQQVAPALGQPRIKALHLPPPPEAGTQRGEFAALELEDGSIGLSYVLLGDTLQTLHDLPAAGPWPGCPALQLAQDLALPCPAGAQTPQTAPAQARRALAWAAAHALGHALMRRAGWAPPMASDSLASLAPGPGDHIGLVGLFGPLMDRLVASGARITVLELRPEWAGQHAGYEVTLDPTALRRCNKVLATGTLLLNDTLDHTLAHIAPGARVALVGPTVSGLPDVLFARGVQVVGGTWVQDGPAFLHALRVGQPRGSASRKFVLTEPEWPGWKALLRA